MVEPGTTAVLDAPIYTRSYCSNTTPIDLTFYLDGVPTQTTWVSYDSVQQTITVSPSDAEFNALLGTTQTVIVVAVDGASDSNSEAILLISFPTSEDLYCPTSALEPAIPIPSYIVYSMLESAPDEPNTQTHTLPEFLDMASIDHLGDASGLFACGPRTYSI